MRKFHYLDTIISPTITEKATSLSEFNKIVFKVHKGANKNSIKKSIEKIFKVKVIKVNTSILRGKIKTFKRSSGYRKDLKKAIVTLAEGNTIDSSLDIK